MLDFVNEMKGGGSIPAAQPSLGPGWGVFGGEPRPKVGNEVAA
jgi:hypothetical protein